MPDRPPDEPNHGSTVVKAWAPWCGSCRAIDPQVRAIAADTGVDVVDVQVDADPDRAAALGVRSVPTLIGLRDGVEVGRLVGAQPADTIEALFRATVSGDGEIASRTPMSLTLARGTAGLVLLAAGLTLGATVLVAVGVALAAWAVSGVATRGR